MAKGGNGNGNGGGDDGGEKCYLRGTRILTPTGERAVEDLRIGDLVVTRWSGFRPVLWIGRQSFNSTFIDSRGTPIRIRAGAIGDSLPAHDLLVSPGHSMLLDGALVLARDLVNGVTVVRDQTPPEVNYYQLDLGRHDCVVANGTWSETMGDEGERHMYHNAAEFFARYPDYVPPDEIELCAPRPTRGPRLDALLWPVISRATERAQPRSVVGYVDQVSPVVTGWACNQDQPDLPVLLDIMVGDKPIGRVIAREYRDDLREAGWRDGLCCFMFRPPVWVTGEHAASMSVRCASNGFVLPLSDGCRARVEGEPTAKPRLRLVS